MDIKRIVENAPDEEVLVIDSDGVALLPTHYSESLNMYMVRSECGEWYSYDEENHCLTDEYAQGDIRSLSDIKRAIELEEIVNMVAHIGVDWGYGKYQMLESDQMVGKARKLITQK